MLGGLTTQQGASGDDAALRDARHDGTDPLRHGAAHGDVILQEQRLGTTHHQVVDHHGDQVEADGVVDVHGLGDRQLGTDPVGGRGDDRFPVAAAQREQSGETAEAAAHFRTGGPLGQRLEQFDRAIAGLDVHPRRRIRNAGAFPPLVWRRLLRHRCQGYRSPRQGSSLLTDSAPPRDRQPPAPAQRPTSPPETAHCGRG